LDKTSSLLSKTLVIGVIFLFIGMSFQSSIGFSNYDDTTPPVTTCTLDPPEPDGLNGWYVSDVTVTLNATDDMSGVDFTYYRIKFEWWLLYSEPFTLPFDGDDILIEYYSVDYAGNVEDVKSFMLDIDQTPPEIDLCYESDYDLSLGWIWLCTSTATDSMSGMDRVEFYINDILQETIYGPGPYYEWIWDYCNFSVIKGFIRKREITEEYVKFRVIFAFTNESIGYDACIITYGYDNAGNNDWDMIFEPPPPRSINWILLFKSLTLPNNYIGYIGRFLIYATFYTG